MERCNKEVERRTDLGGTSPNEASMIGAVRFEQNDSWQSQHRTTMVEAVTLIDLLPSFTANGPINRPK